MLTTKPDTVVADGGLTKFATVKVKVPVAKVCASATIISPEAQVQLSAEFKSNYFLLVIPAQLTDPLQ